MEEYDDLHVSYNNMPKCTRAEQKKLEDAVEQSRGEMIAESLRQAQFDDVRAALVDAGVQVSGNVIGPYSIETLFVRFETETEKVIVAFRFYTYNDGDRSSYFGVVDGCNAQPDFRHKFNMFPLSLHNADKWTAEAKRVGLPVVLQDVCRFTEFVVAMIAPLGTKNSFNAFYPSLFDPYERDGMTYYAGHGGNMPATFTPRFANNGVKFGTSY